MFFFFFNQIHITWKTWRRPWLPGHLHPKLQHRPDSLLQCLVLFFPLSPPWSRLSFLRRLSIHRPLLPSYRLLEEGPLLRPREHLTASPSIPASSSSNAYRQQFLDPPLTTSVFLICQHVSLALKNICIVNICIYLQLQECDFNCLILYSFTPSSQQWFFFSYVRQCALCQWAKAL